jgi:spermidine/putrescine-binding protein
MALASTNCFAEKERSVNVITWWGYLDSPEVAQEVKKQCHVNLSHDTYYTNNEFLRRVNTNKTRYDIIIFTQTIYDLVNVGSASNPLKPREEFLNLQKYAQ